MTRTIVKALIVPPSPEPSASAVADKLSHQDTDFMAKPHLSLRHQTALHPSEYPASERSLGDASKRRLTSISHSVSHSVPLQPPRKMQVSGLNHFNITASPLLIERVKRFYIDTIGLVVGPRAHLDHEGYWLYAGEIPLLHLSACQTMETTATVSKGYFNHISMSCVGLKAAIAKMNVTRTPYRLIQLSDIHQTQIFLTDPAGIGVELTFFNECL